jgi:beta-glucanase (GH16 family)
MTRQFRTFLCLFFIVSVSVQAQKKREYFGWGLVWADEFNVDGAPDKNNWTFEKGFVRNHELQWYQPENAYCKKGKLIIEARRENRPNPNYDPNSQDWKKNRKEIEYTASSLKTQGLHSWKYGRIEMRARIDTRPGLWPAFWTLGVDGEWPRNGEIDIMEFYRGMLLANIAWGSETRFKGVWQDLKKPIETFEDRRWSKKFHVWRMDWDEKAIRLYVDNELLNFVELSQTVNRDGSGKNPFMQPHYLLINLAIGGDNGGDPAGTKFPSKYEIDYVRVYQR